MNDNISTLLCYVCGLPADPNFGYECTKCCALKNDASSGIRRLTHIYYCRFCNRYLDPPKRWVFYQAESKELLACCLKRIVGLKKANLIDAEFIPTDVHSKVLQIKLTVQKTLDNSVITESIFTVEVKIFKSMCDDCRRIEAKDRWRAVVQLRQHVHHKKTFLYLEQVILKSNASKEWNNIKPQKDGLDFFFWQKQQAVKFITFISRYAPVKWTVSDQLVSHDSHCNVYQYKHSFSVEIVPICKHDVVCLPKDLARSYGFKNQLLICLSVTNLIHMLDPCTLKSISMDANTYWKQPFESVFSVKKASLFTVIEKDEDYHSSYQNRSNPDKNSQYKVVDVTLIPNDSFNANEEVVAKTHLGFSIQTGDTVECFDLTRTNINNAAYDSLDSEMKPDIIVIRKYYGDKFIKKQKEKQWKIKRLQDLELKEFDVSDDPDMNDFFQDIIEDREIRKNVDVYICKPPQDCETTNGTPNSYDLVLQKLEDLDLDD